MANDGSKYFADRYFVAGYWHEDYWIDVIGAVVRRVLRYSKWYRIN